MIGFGGIGFWEILLILLLVLIIFGPLKMPEIARGLGKAIYQFKKYSSNLTKDFREEFEKEMRDDDLKGKGTAQMKSNQQNADKPQTASTAETRNVDEG
jgi:TatA/E family protein of Tat protein translocase